MYSITANIDRARLDIAISGEPSVADWNELCDTVISEGMVLGHGWLCAMDVTGLVPSGENFAGLRDLQNAMLMAGVGGMAVLTDEHALPQVNETSVEVGTASFSCSFTSSDAFALSLA